MFKILEIGVKIKSQNIKHSKTRENDIVLSGK